MQKAAARLVRCYFERGTYFQAGCRAYLLQLLYLLAHQFHSTDYLLKETGLTIAEVANQVGFCDQSYFDRRFKAAFGQTPRAFRAKGR